jgi:hypothetical protein
VQRQERLLEEADVVGGVLAGDPRHREQRPVAAAVEHVAGLGPLAHHARRQAEEHHPVPGQALQPLALLHLLDLREEPQRVGDEVKARLVDDHQHAERPDLLRLADVAGQVGQPRELREPALEVRELRPGIDRPAAAAAAADAGRPVPAGEAVAVVGDAPGGPGDVAGLGSSGAVAPAKRVPSTTVRSHRGARRWRARPPAPRSRWRRSRWRPPPSLDVEGVHQLVHEVGDGAVDAVQRRDLLVVPGGVEAGVLHLMVWRPCHSR